MLLIKEIQIKNFRSIVNLTLPTKDMNIFVGLNDAGKSNILKALNLFFNGQTDENCAFNFNLDFSKLAFVGVNKAKEIIVQIKFEIPQNYIDKGELIWKKVWRSDGNIHFDTLRDEKNKFSAYSKTASFLSKIRYTYVPATKSNEYFMRLLGALYSSISYDAESEINKKTIDYAKSIQQFTKGISETIKKNIKIESALAMPPGQADIFKLLTFNTKDDKDNDVYLGQRGDGIKSRHIPAILKFISDYNNRTFNIKGAVPIKTIWGYEEPETGIELSKCFDLAKEFIDYSKEIQIFATTHSPAFYTLKDDNCVEIYHISKDNTTGQSINIENISIMDIHKEIGLMPLISSYIKEKEKEIIELKMLINNNLLIDIPTLFVEGKIDKDTLEYIINIKSLKLKKLIENKKIRIFTNDDGCGTTQLVKWIHTWKYSGFKSKIYVLFDKDLAGKKAKLEIDSLDNEQKPQNMKSQFIKPSTEIKNIFQNMRNKGEFNYELEHLYSIEFWEILKNKNLVIRRDDNEIKMMFMKEAEMNESIDSYLKRAFNNNIRDTIISFIPDDEKKNSIFKKAKEEYGNDNKTKIFDGFKMTLDDIEKYFCS